MLDLRLYIQAVKTDHSTQAFTQFDQSHGCVLHQVIHISSED